jgi:vacuolar protein sorting-associated protein 13A/C
VKYASILLQALTVELDEAFLHAAIDLMRLEGVSWSLESERFVLPWYGEQALIRRIVP